MAKKENKNNQQPVVKPEIKEYIEDSKITDFMKIVNDSDNGYPTFEEIDKVTDVTIITGETRIIDDKVVYLEYDRSFRARLILLSDEKKSYYKKVRNQFNAFQLTLKTTWENEEFYANDKLVAKFGVRGKSLYLYIVKNIEQNTFVRICICSNRAVKAAKELVKDVMSILSQTRSQVKPLKYHIDLERQEKLVEKGLIKLIKSKDIVIFEEELRVVEEDLSAVEEEIEEPVHEHNFINGVCECGEKDPNYQEPVHEHNFINGVCECGEKDPNYQEPVHEHNFINGVCECGEKDPNYQEPVHEHNFINGVCECGEKDPNYQEEVCEMPEAYKGETVVPMARIGLRRGIRIKRKSNKRLIK